MPQTIEREPTPSVQLRRFTPEEYHRMAEIGLFDGERVELIEGEIVQMPPIGPTHTVCTHRGFLCLQRLLGDVFFVRMQSPLSLGDSEPEPDVAVVPGKPTDYISSHPSTAVLVVEVAQSSLEYDRQVKGALYARAGIPEYWLVNLEERRVEVYRDPAPDLGYRSRRIYMPGETLTCLQKPDNPISVDDLLV
ncbi:MAG: hypothetical protein C4335_04200 [Armatimonadota bacterium]